MELGEAAQAAANRGTDTMLWICERLRLSSQPGWPLYESDTPGGGEAVAATSYTVRYWTSEA